MFFRNEFFFGETEKSIVYVRQNSQSVWMSITRVPSQFPLGEKPYPPRLFDAVVFHLYLQKKTLATTTCHKTMGIGKMVEK